MGVDTAATEFLGFVRAVGVDYGSTLTIGRQSRFGSVDELTKALGPWCAKRELDVLAQALRAAGGYADPVFAALGAAKLAALDRSDFEGATILHDLNEVRPDERAGRWTCVFDGGSTEHVFQFPRALETTMRLVAPGGHLVTAVPANQQMGHGFYQVSPEVYFRSLVVENGYQLVGAFLHIEGLRTGWYRITDPAQAGRRLDVATLGPAEMFVCARRVGDAGLHRTPQQSDYADAWETGSTTTPAPASRRSRVRQRTFRAAPGAGRAARAASRLRRRGAAGLERVDLKALAAEMVTQTEP